MFCAPASLAKQHNDHGRGSLGVTRHFFLHFSAATETEDVLRRYCGEIILEEQQSKLRATLDYLQRPNKTDKQKYRERQPAHLKALQQT
jgi:hypothetical protein